MSSLPEFITWKNKQEEPHTGRPDGFRPAVALVGRLDQPGGTQSVMLSLIRGLNNAGIVPDIIWDVPPSTKLLGERGVQTGHQPYRLRVPSRMLDRVPTTIRYLLRVANVFTDEHLSRRYDFYYIFYNGFLVKEAPHVRYLNGTPLLPQLDNVSPGLRGLPYRIIRAIYRGLLRRRFPAYEYHRDSRYVINAHYTSTLFEEAYGVALPVVHPPIDLSGRSFTAGDIGRRDTITFFSRFADYKRPELVIRLAGYYPDRRFLLMGGVKPAQREYFESLRAMASRQNLRNVTFIDNPSDERIREELARTRFYVFPAVNEHFGMTTAEAIGSGAVPYVHDSGGQREIVPDARLRFTDDRFIEQFAALQSLSDEDLIDIQIRLRDHVAQFSEDAFIEKMIAFLGITASPVVRKNGHAKTVGVKDVIR